MAKIFENFIFFSFVDAKHIFAFEKKVLLWALT
jgi:hypothetical protein